MARLFTTTALITLIASTPALADITAKQAWADWHDQMTSSGYEVIFDKAISDGILTINNLTISKELEEGQGSFITTLGSIGYRERGDGTVEVILATDAPMTFQPNNGQNFTFARHHTDMSYIISGSPDAMTHTVHAGEITFTLTEMVIDGERVEDAKIDLILKNPSSTALMKTADLSEVVAEYAIAELAYDIDLKYPGEVVKTIIVKGSFTDWQASIDAAVPVNFDPEEFLAAIDAGMAMNINVGYGATSNQFSVTQGKGSVIGSFLATKGGFVVELGTTADGLIKVVERLSLGSLSLDLETTDIDLDSGMTLKVSLADMKGAIEGLIPKGFYPDEMPAAFDAGLAGKINLSHGAITGTVSTKDPENSVFGTLSVQSGNLFATADRKTLHYGGEIIDEKLSLTDSRLPVSPMEYSLGEAAFNLLMPIRKSDEPEAFEFKFKLSDLWISESIWQVTDPTGALSHEPITVILDVSGMANWLIDILDAESEEAQGAVLKGQLHALSLNTLRMIGAGATLIGGGAFTFNNDDLETFYGMPAPTGTLDLKLTGASTLIDTLVEIGLLPTDQAMGARMAMGLVMVAGEGEDVLTSAIEVSEDGKVLANGKRLK